MGTHINEEYYDINGIVSDNRDNLFDEGVRKDAKEFFSKFYLWDKDLEEFNDNPEPNYRPYEIKVKQESECCDDEFIDIISVNVMLPTDEDAQELADILDGTVVSGLNADGKEFCITYTKKIVIKAKNKAEAKKLFDDMDMQYADRWADFGKISSIVCKTEKKTKKSKK